MTIFLLSALINVSLALLILALTVLVIVVTVGQVRKVAYLSLVDIIELRSRWIQSATDLKNNQVMADLEQKRLADEVRHRGKILEAEADSVLLPVRRERLELLSSLDEVTQ